MSQREPIPVACTLGTGDLAGRVARWRAVAARAAGRRASTEHGVRLSFAAGPGVAAELRELAVLERDCCAFATWSVRQDGDRILVDVSGDTQEAATAVQEMFSELAS
jgi:hypothetical protein